MHDKENNTSYHSSNSCLTSESPSECAEVVKTVELSIGTIASRRF